MSAQQGQSGDGKRITQNEFTDKAWQSIIAAPDIAKQVAGHLHGADTLHCGLSHAAYLFNSENSMTSRPVEGSQVVM